MRKVKVDGIETIFLTMFTGFALLINYICGSKYSSVFMLLTIVIILMEAIKTRCRK
jgi:hypothetical protein